MVVLRSATLQHVKDAKGEHWVAYVRVRGFRRRTFWFNCRTLGCKHAQKKAAHFCRFHDEKFVADSKDKVSELLSATVEAEASLKQRKEDLKKPKSIVQVLKFKLPMPRPQLSAARVACASQWHPMRSPSSSAVLASSPILA